MPIKLPPRPGLLIVLSGPSGVGKDVTLKRMKELGLPFTFVTTMTTRAMRPGEVEGEDYHFISTQAFEQMIADKELLEYAVVYGEYKGIPKQAVRAALAKGEDVVLRIDIQGAATIKRLAPEAIFIFLLAPNMVELERRLRERRTESEQALQLRLQTAIHEMQALDEFDYYVINYADCLDETVAEIKAIIGAEKARVKPREIRL